jgi:hypothetical protein
MARAIRNLLVYGFLVVTVVLAAMIWGYFLHSVLGDVPALASLSSTAVGYAQVVVQVPILFLVGAAAAWLFEGSRRLLWSIALSFTVGAIFPSIAPTDGVSSERTVLWAYWLSIASMAVLTLLAGSWLCAKLLLRRARRLAFKQEP